MVDVLIKKLIDKTETGEYEWRCIGQCIEDNCNLVNNSLRKYVLDNNKKSYNRRLKNKSGFFKKLFKSYNYELLEDFIYYPLSYILEIEGGAITLLTYCEYTETPYEEAKRYYRLIAQNNPNGFPGAINFKDEFQEELLQLLKTIKNKNDNVDTIIKKIIGNN